MENSIKKEILRDILRQNNLDIILIYSDHYNYKYTKWITGVIPFLFNYYFITLDNSGFLEIDYLSDALKKQVKEPIFEIQEDKVNENLIDFLKSYKNIGIAGNIPYKHIYNFVNTFNIQLIDDILDRYLFIKSDEDIEKISLSANVLKQSLIDIESYIKKGVYIKDIEKNLRKILLDKSQNLAFPISIVAIDKIKQTTVSIPYDYKLTDKEIVCIDAGCVLDGYYSDSTRCYFINQDEAFEKYELFKKAHYEVIENLYVNMPISQIPTIYKDILSKYSLPADTLQVSDLGHSIGFYVHEIPFIYNENYKDFYLQNNIVFTLEPEIIFDQYRLRIEDMVALKNNKFQILT